MAQNFSYFQNQMQQQAGGLGGQPQMPGVGGNGMPASAAQSMGMTPQEFAMLQQMMANPNAADAFGARQAMGAPPEFQNPFGDPKLMLVGGLAGIPVSMAIEKLHGVEHSRIAGIARKLDSLPVINGVSNFLENKVLTHLKGTWADEMLNRTARSLGPDEAMRVMQANHINALLKPFADSHKTLLAPLTSAKTLEQFSTTVDDQIIRLLQDALNKGNLDGKLAEKVTAAVTAGTVDHKVLGLARKVASADSKEALKVLSGLRRGVRSVQSHYMPMFADQAVLAHKLKDVGPIGRMFAATSNYIRRMFGGEVMKNMPGMGNRVGQAAAQEGSGLVGKLLGPFMAGFITIGSALSKAKDAPAGEKVSTFFHDFFGFGVGTLLGMEMGAKYLRGPLTRLLGSKAVAAPLKFLRFIPGIGPWFAGLSAVGILTQVLAMTVVAEPFKRLGEWLSHRIFGKPSQETIDKIEGKTPKDKPVVPATANGQGLDYSGPFEQLRSRIHTQSPITNGAAAVAQQAANTAQQYSLTPDQIIPSLAAQRSDQIAQQVLAQPWDARFFDPAGQAGH